MRIIGYTPCIVLRRCGEWRAVATKLGQKTGFPWGHPKFVTTGHTVTDKRSTPVLGTQSLFRHKVTPTFWKRNLESAKTSMAGSLLRICQNSGHQVGFSLRVTFVSSLTCTNQKKKKKAIKKIGAVVENHTANLDPGLVRPADNTRKKGLCLQTWGGQFSTRVQNLSPLPSAMPFTCFLSQKMARNWMGFLNVDITLGWNWS